MQILYLIGALCFAYAYMRTRVLFWAARYPETMLPIEIQIGIAAIAILGAIVWPASVGVWGLIASRPCPEK